MVVHTRTVVSRRLAYSAHCLYLFCIYKYVRRIKVQFYCQCECKAFIANKGGRLEPFRLQCHVRSAAVSTFLSYRARSMVAGVNKCVCCGACQGVLSSDSMHSLCSFPLVCARVSCHLTVCIVYAYCACEKCHCFYILEHIEHNQWWQT